MVLSTLRCESNNDMDAPLAQLVEHLTLNQGVQGSSPWRCTERIFFEVTDFGGGSFILPGNRKSKENRNDL